MRARLISSPILHRYFAWAFFKAIVQIMIFISALVFLIDITELLRRTSSLPNVSLSAVVLLSLIRTPTLMEQIFPFAVLIGSMGTLFMLSRRLELVVTRGAGVSIWQFMLPGFFVATILGIFATTALNPIVEHLNDKASLLEADIFKRDAKLISGTESSVWLKKTGGSEDIIVGAASARKDGGELLGVTIIRLNKEGKLLQRLDADSARLQKNQWILDNAAVTGPTIKQTVLARYSLRLDLTREDVQEGFSKSLKRSFWSLPNLIKKARAANLPTNRYSLQFNTLLAQPFFFMAMVVIAATVSLRFIRSGNVSGLVISGIAAGFLLYVLRSLAEDLGGAGVVQPLLAAWLPTLLALVVGFTLLLHLEDG